MCVCVCVCVCVCEIYKHIRRNVEQSHWKEGNVLFNDTLNTFYLRLYGVRHMVKNHSDREIGNPLPPHGLLFPISSNFFFIYMRHPTDRITHTTAFVTPVVVHWMEREFSLEYSRVIQLNQYLPSIMATRKCIGWYRV